ncbi:hypothetical protein UFOVP130_29 [uncultured Caudovirales phage]|uniref:Uncharacterized protein n=1 Tax=uncultured Caudovirales phage TaxID=2100421 RepID=A0A6J5LC83_9CAUD|nr:hypothetical protein UFOVP130_29 [uncultured Caudovirales phage]
MPASTSGSKTVTTAVAPHLSATSLTALLAIAVENLTVAQFDQIKDALDRVPKGRTPGSTIGSLLT